MVVSLKNDGNKVEFEAILKKSLEELNQRAKISPHKLISLQGTKLEPYTKDIISEHSVGTSFEGSIELISGQKFPDIIANDYFGIEVKTSQNDNWKSTGNSIFESTRVKSVERIYLLFGKYGNGIEYKIKPYEDCLSDIVVTHSPRYLIDMNLSENETIFSKIKMGYDELRKSEDPIKPITTYYKSKLRKGQNLWWIQDTSKSSKLVIDIWNNLKSSEREELKVKGFVFFPEIVGTDQDKFSRFAIWLTTMQSVVCPNIRDIYTAGGRGDFQKKNFSLKSVPRIILNLFESYDSIMEVIKETPAAELNEYWGTTSSEYDKIDQWKKQILINVDFGLQSNISQMFRKLGN